MYLLTYKNDKANNKAIRSSHSLTDYTSNYQRTVRPVCSGVSQNNYETVGLSIPVNSNSELGS